MDKYLNYNLIWLSVLLLIMATLFWAGNFVLARSIVNDIHPVTLNFWRWTISGLILLPFAIKGFLKHRKIIFVNVLLLTALAVTGVSAFHTLVYLSLITTTVINASLMMATVPLIVPVLSFFLHGERVTVNQKIGVLISLSGVILIITRGNIINLKYTEFIAGDLWMLVAVFLWSFYTVLLKRIPESLPPLISLFSIIAIGVILLLPFYLIEYLNLGGFSLCLTNLLSIGYIALLASIVAFIFWNKAVSNIGPNIAGLFIHLLPIFSSLMAIMFLEERFSTFHFVGIFFIVSGILLSLNKVIFSSSSKSLLF